MLCAAPSTPHRREAAYRRRSCGATIGRREGSPGWLLCLAWPGFLASEPWDGPVLPSLQSSPPPHVIPQNDHVARLAVAELASMSYERLPSRASTAYALSIGLLTLL